MKRLLIIALAALMVFLGANTASAALELDRLYLGLFENATGGNSIVYDIGDKAFVEGLASAAPGTTLYDASAFVATAGDPANVEYGLFGFGDAGFEVWASTNVNQAADFRSFANFFNTADIVVTANLNTDLGINDRDSFANRFGDGFAGNFLRDGGNVLGLGTETGLFNFDNDTFIANLVVTSDGVLETAAPIPVPAAVWLLGSGLLGLIGIRRKMA